MKRNLLFKGLTISLVISMALGISACGKTEKTSAGDTKKENTETKAPEGPSGKLRMMMWSNAGTVNPVKEINDKFIKKYPNVKIEFVDLAGAEYTKSLTSRISANDVDLFATQAYAYIKGDYYLNKGEADLSTAEVWAQQGLLEDLSSQSFIKKYSAKAIKDASTINGKILGVTTGRVAFNGVFYNKKIFEQNGLKEPKTWDEYMNLCKTLKDKGIPAMTCGGKDVWPFAVSAEGVFSAFETGDMNDVSKDFYLGNRKYNDEKSMKFWKGLWDWTSYMEPGFMGVDYNNVIGRFLAGKAAMMPDGSWQAANIDEAIKKANSDFKYGFFVMPGEKQGDSASLAGKYDLQWAVMSKSPNKALALKWLEFFSEKDNYSLYVNAAGFIPTQEDVEIKNEFIKSILPLAKDFRLAQEIVWTGRKGAGEFAAFCAPNNFSIAGGKFKSYQEAADQAQKDHDKGEYPNKK